MRDLALIIIEIGAITLATLEEVQASIDALSTAVDTETAELSTLATELSTANQEIADLTAKVNSGSNVTAADLDGLSTRLKGITDKASAAVAAVQPAAPAPDPGTAPAPTPDPGTAPAPDPGTPGNPGPQSPDPVPAGDPAAPATTTEGLDKTVYTFGGDLSTVDATAWQASGYDTPDGRPLFFFAGDTAKGDNNGDGQDGGAWVRYVGDVQQSAESSTAA